MARPENPDERIPFCIFAFAAANESNGWENWTEALDPECKQSLEQNGHKRINELSNRDKIEYPENSDGDPEFERHLKQFQKMRLEMELRN